MFEATEEVIAAIWRTPLFGMSAQRRYAVSVSVSAGEPASLREFERDGSLRIIAARSDRPLHETDLAPGETYFGIWILTACLVTVCGVAYLLLSS